MFLRVTHICGTSIKKSKGITNTEFRIVLTAIAERRYLSSGSKILVIFHFVN